MGYSSNPAPSSGALIACWMLTIFAMSSTTLISMMMAFGIGSASPSDDPASRTAQMMWSLSGMALVPCVGLLLVLTAKRQRIWAVVLSIVLIGAGLIAAGGWFYESNRELPDTTTSMVMVLAVLAIPLLASTVILRLSRNLYGPATSA